MTRCGQDKVSFGVREWLAIGGFSLTLGAMVVGSTLWITRQNADVKDDVSDLRTSMAAMQADVTTLKQEVGRLRDHQGWERASQPPVQ